jgi:hypothetical protein
MRKEELIKKVKSLGDFGFTGESIEFKELLITCSSQNKEGISEYFVYGEEDESEDGIFSSLNSEEIVDFVFNY